MSVDILEIIKNRRSIREFQRKAIPRDLVVKIEEALVWAPSAGNLQSRKFYFVSNQKTKKELAIAASNQDFIATAPLIIVGCTDERIALRYGERGKNLYSICDTAASIQNMMLLAHNEGLGSCWVGTFNEKEVAKILKLPEKLRPIAIIPIGYPAEKPPIPKHLPKTELIKFKE